MGETLTGFLLYLPRSKRNILVAQYHYLQLYNMMMSLDASVVVLLFMKTSKNKLCGSTLMMAGP